MSNREIMGLLGVLLLTMSVLCPAQHPPASPAAKGQTQQLPDTPGKETVQKVCGSCHSPQIVLGRALTKEQWSEVVAGMITRGAKGTEAEFTQVIDYLSSNFPPKQGPATGAPAKRRGGGGFSVGPDDKHVVDEESAARGKPIYIAECVTCHGPTARGTDRGADLVRSQTLLHDRYGSTIGPFLHKGHPSQSGVSSANFTEAQIGDLSNFLHQQLDNTLRSGPYNKVLNVLTGDSTTGAAYFNGEGKCSSCHSPTGDLAGIASKYDPPTLQQRFLFPRTVGFGRKGVAQPKPVTVTVTLPGGREVSGVLDKIDDFSVSLRDASGEYDSWQRTPDLKIEKHDPYEAHIELLDRYTDKNIHDVVAYLETLK